MSASDYAVKFGIFEEPEKMFRETNNTSRSLLLVFLCYFLMSFATIAYADHEEWDKYLRSAEDALVRGDRSRAAFQFSVARDTAWKLDNATGVARAGFGFARLGNVEEAKDSWLIVRDISRAQKDWRGLIQAAHGLMSIGATSKAEDLLQEADALVQESNDLEGFLTVGLAYTGTESHTRAFRAGRSAQELAEKEGRSIVAFYSARIFALIGLLDEARGAARIAENIGKTSERWRGYSDAARIYIMTGDYEEARRTARLAQRLAKKQESIIGLMFTARIFHRAHDESAAERSFAQANIIANALGESEKQRLGVFVHYKAPARTLFVLDNGETVPGLAESWEVGSNGDLLTVKIRSGITCVNGQEIDAHSIVDTINRNRNRMGSSRFAALWAKQTGKYQVVLGPARLFFMFSDPTLHVRC